VDLGTERQEIASLRVADLGDQVGLHHHAPVPDRSGDQGHVQRVGAHVLLADGRLGLEGLGRGQDVGVLHTALGEDLPLGEGDVEADVPPEPEPLRLLGQGLPADGDAELPERDVARDL
jgi:hypothetical protein